MRRFLPSKRLTFVLTGSLSAIALAIYGLHWVSKWNDNREAEKFASLSRPLVEKLAEKLNVSYVDAARVFVFSNTDHDMQSEWYRDYATDLSYVLEQLYKTATSAENAERPDLACGYRVEAMKYLLNAAAISADTVYLYNDTGSDPNQNSHVVLEVLNPVSSRREVHDVDFNAKYQRDDGTTVSLSDLLKTSVIDSFKICDEVGCETDRLKPTAVGQADYYKGVYYRNRDVFVLSTSKFDVEKRFTIHRLRGDEVMDVYDYFNYIYPKAPIVEF